MSLVDEVLKKEKGLLRYLFLHNDDKTDVRSLLETINDLVRNNLISAQAADSVCRQYGYDRNAPRKKGSSKIVPAKKVVAEATRLIKTSTPTRRSEPDGCGGGGGYRQSSC